MKKARRQMHERLSTGLAELSRIKPTDFVREDVGRDLSFRVGLPYFDRTLELFHRISLISARLRLLIWRIWRATPKGRWTSSTEPLASRAKTLRTRARRETF
jgi:hypothetical protein